MPGNGSNSNNNNNNGDRWRVHITVALILMLASGAGGACIGVLGNMVHVSEKYVLKEDYRREMDEIKLLIRSINGKLDKLDGKFDRYITGAKNDRFKD